MKRRDDLAPTTATAQVYNHAVLDADVHDPTLEYLRRELDELVLDAVYTVQS